MTEYEPGYIVTQYWHFINGVDKVVWVSQ